MRKSLYIETSVISYLAARPSRNLVAAAWQQVTAEWWETHRDRFDLFISELVIAEVSEGSAEAAARRLDLIKNIPELEITRDVEQLAQKLVEEGALPKNAMDDAVHIALAAVHGVDYLLTWNYRHIDNAERRPLVRTVCAIAGHKCPEICTPQELMGEEENGR